MKKIIKYSLLIAALITAFNTYSQDCKSKTAVIKGTYRGKSLFFQNTGGTGLQKIFVDDKEVVSKFNSTVFELPLSNLKIGQKFKLKIIYCNRTPVPYKIVNPGDIK